MLFEREIYQKLKNWKTKKQRKPLLLMGARQIGKTTLLKAFGKQEFTDYAYFNLEENTDIHSFFEREKDPNKIIRQLNLLSGTKIEAGTSLLILDEIQECRDALIALKYFQEKLPQQAIVAAGSLLGLSLGQDRSFPVGKVEFIDLYPLSFSEYLHALDKQKHAVYHHFLESEKVEQIPQAFFQSLATAFKEYLLAGGMPEVAAQFIQGGNFGQAQTLQDQLLRAYQLDFVKHAENTTATKIQHIWNALPSQLAKENKKFLYKVVKKGARAREYEAAIQWLKEAGLVYKIPRIETARLPLKAYEDLSSFKLYVFEIGLLMRLANLHSSTFIEGSHFFTEFKGALAENFVAQSLHKQLGSSVYYWTSNGKAELDFIINYKGEIIPIEVKSGINTKAKSLAIYTERYQPKLRVRISNLNLSLQDGLLNIPLFYAESLDTFIDKALK